MTGTVDWERVKELRDLRVVNDGFVPDGLDLTDPAALARSKARRAYGMGQYDEASRRWLAQDGGPQGPMDLTVLGEIFAAGGDDRARQSIEALRTEQPAEAAALEARARYVAGDRADATRHLIAAFRMCRLDPWPHREVFTRALQLASRIANDDPEQGDRLFEALTAPFAVRALDMNRLATRAAIGLRDGTWPLCGVALAPLEPHVPWQLDFLERRATCYARLGSPLASRARADVQAYRADAQPGTAFASPSTSPASR